jgi:hypothetical protein
MFASDCQTTVRLHLHLTLKVPEVMLIDRRRETPEEMSVDSHMTHLVSGLVDRPLSQIVYTYIRTDEGWRSLAFHWLNTIMGLDIRHGYDAPCVGNKLPIYYSIK